MGTLHERRLVGLAAVEAVTALLQRARAAHPTAGLYEAADLQWWWRRPRATDTVPQLVWVDAAGRPEAAALVLDRGDRISLDPILLPGAFPDLVNLVVERGLAHARATGSGRFSLEVDPGDAVLGVSLADHGFVVEEERGYAEAWLPAAARPPVSPLPPGYQLRDRAGTQGRPHHLVPRDGPDVEARLRQTSLYRPELDLAVMDDREAVAAYGVFWFDPATGTGLVEPMRTEEGHRRRGLARHVLTSGLDRLLARGASRIKICYEPDNVAARDLYLDAGFQPFRQTIVMAGPVG